MRREDAIKTLEYQRKHGNMEEAVRQSIAMAIEALTVIESLQDKTRGKWIVKQGNYCGVELKEFFCDKCGTRGALRRVFSDPEPLPNFCGHCGADMRGGADD